MTHNGRAAGGSAPLKGEPGEAELWQRPPSAQDLPGAGGGFLRDLKVVQGDIK